MEEGHELGLDKTADTGGSGGRGTGEEALAITWDISSASTKMGRAKARVRGWGVGASCLQVSGAHLSHLPR